MYSHSCFQLAGSSGTRSSGRGEPYEYASDRRDLLSVRIPRGRQGVVVTEQLVCAVNQVDFQGGLQLNMIRVSLRKGGAELSVRH